MSPILISYTDQEGNTLPRLDAQRIASENLSSILTPRELSDMLVEKMSDDELMHWATNDEGLFPDQDGMHEVRNRWQQEDAMQQMVDGDPFGD